jgi:hypothetical protein
MICSSLSLFFFSFESTIYQLSLVNALFVRADWNEIFFTCCSGLAEEEEKEGKKKAGLV